MTVSVQKKPAAKGKKTAPSVFNNQKVAMESIVTQLKKFPGGLKELELYGRYDPIMITRLLEVLVKRGVVEMTILDDQVGASRRRYKLRTE